MNPYDLPRHSLNRFPLGPVPAFLVLLLALGGLATGCGGPEAGALADVPLGITYETGDANNTIDGQLGLAADPTQVTVNGGLGFQGPATVSCGPHAEGFLLRFAPEGRRDSVLTLLLPHEGHGGHGGGHGGGQGEEHGTEASHGPSSTASSPAESQRKAQARLVRVQNGELVESTGTAQVEKHATSHVAGRHAISGSFTAQIDGTELSGDFAHCFYFPG